MSCRIAVLVVLAGRAGSGVRMRSSDTADTANDTASTRIREGGADHLNQGAGEPRAADLGERRARRELAVPIDDAIDADQRRDVRRIGGIEQGAQHPSRNVTR